MISAVRLGYFLIMIANGECERQTRRSCSEKGPHRRRRWWCETFLKPSFPNYGSRPKTAFQSFYAGLPTRRVYCAIGPYRPPPLNNTLSSAPGRPENEVFTRRSFVPFGSGDARDIKVGCSRYSNNNNNNNNNYDGYKPDPVIYRSPGERARVVGEVCIVRAKFERRV